MHAASTAVVFEHIPWLTHFAKRVPFFGNALKSLRASALEKTAQRYESGAPTSHKDLFYYLSNEDGAEKQSPAPPIVISDGVLALVAGSHTTSSVLSNLFYLLLRHPVVYERLQYEVDKVCDVADPTCEARIPYLDAVM